jgi:hypothetical protein
MCPVRKQEQKTIFVEVITEHLVKRNDFLHICKEYELTIGIYIARNQCTAQQIAPVQNFLYRIIIGQGMHLHIT